MIKQLIYKIITLPRFFMYRFYDYLFLQYTKQINNFCGFGVHLYVGLFGQGKTCTMVYDAYKLARKHEDLHILTNIKLKNFPEHTKILELNSIDDIINAPADTLVLIDEIGTIFNSRDFNSSCGSGISKSLFQHLCQCRKRNVCVYGTVQRYGFLDKQIRDITADVTVCRSSPSYPYTRYISYYCYDIEDYEIYYVSRTYQPKPLYSSCFFQSDFIRSLYDTSELVENMLKKKYISDDEILKNRGDVQYNVTPISKKDSITIRHRNKL